MFSRFERMVDPFPDEPVGRPPDGLAAFCWHYVKGFWPVLAAMSVLSAAVGLGEAFIYSMIGNLVDWLVEQDRATFLADNAWRLTGMGLFVVVVLPAVTLFQTLFVHQALIGNFGARIRWLGHRRLLRQSTAFYADEFAGRVATKLMQTSLAVRETVMKLADIIVYVLSYFIGMMIVAAAADWRLMAPMVVWFVFYISILRYFVPRLGEASRVQADARAVMTGRVVDSYTNIMTVKLFAHGARERDFARESMAEFLATVHRQMRLISVMNVLLFTSQGVLLASVTAVSIHLWLNEAITLGAIAVGIGLVLRLGGLSFWVMWETAGLFENIGTAMDGKAMLTREVSVEDLPGAPPLTVGRGDIRFDNVTFHYGKKDGVIDAFDLHIQPGEKVGIVGRSGAGKTTLMNLLLRLYDVEGGRITIDGQDIATVDQDSLRAAIGVVTQDTALLHRSVRANISYGRSDASEADIRTAAARAKADRFIAGLSDLQGRSGLDAHVGERGVKLSGGQRQRIAIARIFLKDAPILVLDEATSALDSEVEAAIQESLFDLMAGKTVIAIAHRLSTISALDRLIVMDEGRIVETGSHQELLARGGLYAQLWQRQSGGFIESGDRARADTLPPA